MLKEKLKNANKLASALGSGLMFVLYVVLFGLVEKADPANVTIVHCALDDLIPFTRFAAIPYCFWHAEIFIVLIYYLCNEDRSKWLNAVLMIWMTFMFSLLIYRIFPSQVNLRPESVPQNDLAGILTRLVYYLDDNQNVLPSLHAAIAWQMMGLWLRTLKKPKSRVLAVLINAATIISTVFLKQHSVLDIVAGVVYGFLMEQLFQRHNIFE